MRPPSCERPPEASRWLRDGFAAYSRRYVWKHFQTLRLRGADAAAIEPTEPLVIYMNHAAWWDPMVALIVTRRLFPDRTFAAPMDAASLERYGIFKRLGFFGVERGGRAGARRFLERSLAALTAPGGALCLTPQGRFSDVRERPLQFQSGLGWIARKLGRGVFLPMAVEYAFGEDRFPEISVRLGEPLRREAHPPLAAGEWTRLLEERLVSAQDALATDVQRREFSDYAEVLSTARGVGGVYEAWGRIRALIRGEKFVARHSAA